MESLWLADAKIKAVKIGKHIKYTISIPEAYIRAANLAEGVMVSVYMENGNLKVIPHESIS